MKKILIFLIGALLLSVSNINAQVVDGITYQAVAVDEDGKEIAGMDANGNILHSKTMNVRFTIIEGSSSGNIVYQEIHSTNTDPNGLFSVIIGHGEITNDSPNQSILDIAWGSNKHFLKVELDVKNRNEYKLMGIQQMMAVPYALYALNSGKADSIAGFSGDYNDLTNTPNIPTNTSDLTNDSGFITSPDDADSDPTNEIQILSISNDTIYLTNGGFVKLPAGFSGDYNDLINQPTIPTVPTNVSAFTNDAGYLTSFTESQILSISNDTIYLTGGSFVKLPAGFSGDYNDLTNTPDFTGWDTNVSDDFDGDYNNLSNQPTIPVNTSDLINDSGFITSADDADPDPSNELQTLSISNDTIYLSDGGFVKLPSASSSSSVSNSTFRVGFTSSGTWTCPDGVSQIIVELWGGSGGGGGGDYVVTNATPRIGCDLGYVVVGGSGGKGGNGGYNKQLVSVTPGTVYNITVGNGGAAGNASNCSISQHATNGTAGGSSSFNGIIVADGGGAGLAGSSWGGGCSGGAAGSDGAIINYNIEYVSAASTSQIRSYVPEGYTTVNLSTTSNNNGGSGGTGASRSTSVVGGCNSGSSGTAGQAGYCIIYY
jgi:hypothetical protein